MPDMNCAHDPFEDVCDECDRCIGCNAHDPPCPRRF